MCRNIYRAGLLLCRKSTTHVQAASLLRFQDQTQSHTLTHTHTRQDVSARVISTSQRTLPTLLTVNKSKNFPAVSGIRTRDFSSRAAADLRLRPHGRRYQLVPHYRYVKIVAYTYKVPYDRA